MNIYFLVYVVSAQAFELFGPQDATNKIDEFPITNVVFQDISDDFTRSIDQYIKDDNFVAFPPHATIDEMPQIIKINVQLPKQNEIVVSPEDFLPSDNLIVPPLKSVIFDDSLANNGLFFKDVDLGVDLNDLFRSNIFNDVDVLFQRDFQNFFPVSRGVFSPPRFTIFEEWENESNEQNISILDSVISMFYSIFSQDEDDADCVEDCDQFSVDNDTFEIYDHGDGDDYYGAIKDNDPPSSVTKLDSNTATTLPISSTNDSELKQRTLKYACVEDALKLCTNGKASVDFFSAMACLNKNVELVSNACLREIKNVPSFHCAADIINICKDTTKNLRNCLLPFKDKVSSKCLESIKNTATFKVDAAKLPNVPLVKTKSGSAVPIQSQPHSPSSQNHPVGWISGGIVFAFLIIYLARSFYQCRKRNARVSMDNAVGDSTTSSLEKGFLQSNLEKGLLQSNLKKGMPQSNQMITEV